MPSPIGLPTASLPIGALFASPYLFSIPAYQRPFSWTTEEAGQLLDYIVAASGVDDPETKEQDYFLGSILLLDLGAHEEADLPPTAGAPRAFAIVDGQQRLVSLTLTACVLRDLDEHDGDTDPAIGRLDALVASQVSAPERQGNWRLELRGREQAFMESYVLRRGACGSMPDESRLDPAQARMFAIRESFAAKLSELDRAQRAALAAYLCERCYFVVMQTRDIDRAHRLFLVLNGRGKPLSRHDILKAELLSGLSAAAAEAALRTWEETSIQLGPDHFEHFFGHLRAIHGQHKPQIIRGIRALIAQTGGAQPFMDSVFAPYARAYRQILREEHDGFPQPGEVSQEIRATLAYLCRLNGREWVPPAMVAIHQLADEPHKLAGVLGQIDRLAHLLRILCLGSGKRVRRFAPITAALRETGSVPDDLWDLSREERRSLAHHLRDLYNRNALTSKLLLMRLNDRLAGRFTGASSTAFTVEHILPQRPSATSQWRTWFADGAEREAMSASLGNLILITPNQNERARNQEFARKQDIYRDARRGASIDAMQPLLEGVLEATDWKADAIVAREARLIELLNELWNLDVSVRAAGRATHTDTGPSQQRTAAE